MSEEDDELVREQDLERLEEMDGELRAFAEAYRDAEASGTPVRAFSRGGWHLGAQIGSGVAEAILRIGPHSTNGMAFLYCDTGEEAVFIYQGQLGSEEDSRISGFTRDFARRPFSVARAALPGACGVLAPGAEKLDVVSENGTVFPADVVAHTFAVAVDFELASVRRLNELRKVDLREAGNWRELKEAVRLSEQIEDETREQLYHGFTVRVYDGDDTLLYTGPVLDEEDEREEQLVWRMEEYAAERDRRLWLEPLERFIEFYRAVEANGIPAQAVSHAGWHSGARIGADTTEGMLAYTDSGDVAEFILRDGQLDLFGILEGAFRWNTTRCPFHIKGLRLSGVYGVLAPSVETLEVTSEDGTTFPVDIVAQTFTVTIGLDLPYQRTINQLFEAGASGEEQYDVVLENDPPAEERAATRHLTIRAYDGDGTLLYEGPLLPDD